jgi:(+)-trans-carveol dehydrogenase
MTGRLQGKVAFVTGAARGQGRSHAVRLAQEGADIIAVDICGQIESVPYPMATEEDLEQTVKEVEGLDRRILASKADVRNFADLKQAVDTGVSELGRLDIVSANAGIFSIGRADELSEASWNDMIDVALNGVWHTAKAAVPHLIEAGGGSMILTSSANGQVGAPMYAHYVAAKHGVIGLMRALAMELAPHAIRVNAVLPGGVATRMIRDFRDVTRMSARYEPPQDPENAAFEAPFLESVEISNAIVFLASDEARFVTGAAFPIAGMALLWAGGAPDEPDSSQGIAQSA